ncbi:hypothetical protein [Myroides sp. DF42-4-2]|uniref:hypothetical protein n=1 Tax=unclassified Myroides TaxID=2642485 RepID=UPI002576CD2A|nr:hypothetical protein [Myroides sp. DF42-4-2]MDM1406307.1 hypothetical protein [Myroides sp. DF42-4-2]
MRKIYSSLFILLFLLVSGQTKVVAQQASSVFQEYNQFLDVKFYDSSPYVVIKEVDLALPGATAVNRQPSFWDFLIINHSARLDYDALAQINDSIVVSQKVIQHLESDATFATLVQNYRAKVVDHTQAKDTVHMDKILNVAVKFFNLTGVTAEGAYSARVCVGINPLKNTERTRSPYLEAFAFDAIINNLRSESYPFYDYYIKAIQKIYKLNLGTNDQDQLLRAQGALFIQMLDSTDLQQLLKDEYERKKDILPFVLRSS